MKKFTSLITLIILASLACIAGAAEKPKITIYTSMYEDIGDD